MIILAVVLLTPARAQQTNLARVEQMPNLPAPYLMRDWRSVAVAYDSLVFNLDVQGEYLPLVWIDPNTVNYPAHASFGLHTVVGTPHPESAEAINAIPALVGATLAGVDKSDHYGRNWVLMAEEWFNRRPEENVYLNHPVSTSGSDWWYDTMPNVFFFQLYDLYPGTGHFSEQLTIVAHRWLRAVEEMGGSAAPWSVPYMRYRGWHLATMTPNVTDVEEPEAAGALAWLLYMAYVETGELRYRQGAEWAMEFLEGLSTNPSYELQMPYGAYAAARMNAELGTRYDVEKLLNWCFEVGPLRNWGVILGTWGGYDVHGLVGEAGANGYAFAMNTFEHVGALVPLVRYDDRFARAIGKWVLNAANAARLFYPAFLADSLQDSDAWAHQYDPQSTIAHEALREFKFGRSPYGTGDAIDGGWGATNLALYGASHVGIFGGIIDTTDVPGILRLDVRRTDYFQDAAYPTHLYYNPYDESRSVAIELPAGTFRIYDAAGNQFLSDAASGTLAIDIPPDAARLIVRWPSDADVTNEYGRLLADGRVVDYRTDVEPPNHPPRIKGLAAEQAHPGAANAVHCTAEDVESETLTYSWTASSGTIAGEGSIVTWTAPAAGETVTLGCAVRDGGGLEASEEIDVTVVAAVPVVTAVTASPRKVDLGATSTLSCAATHPTGEELAYAWEADGGDLQGDGNEVTWTAPGMPGEFGVTCRVETASGLRAEGSTTVVVRDFSAGGSGDLVAWYRLDEDATDASGYANDGFLSGPTPAANVHREAGRAMRFDGVNDFIRVPNSDRLNFQKGVTLAFWMRADAFFEREAYPISHGNWENRWKVSLTDERLRWTVKTTDGTKDLDSETILEEGVFYHVVVRYDGSDIEIYLNGELDAFDTFSGDLLETSIDLTIGQVLPDNSAYNFAGILDEIRIYDYALATNAVLALYSAATPIEGGSSPLPTRSELHAPYPNPFHDKTTLGFDVAEAARVRIRVFNVLGRLVDVIVDADLSPGSYETAWDGGGAAASGMYLFEMDVGSAHLRRWVIFAR